MYLKTGLIPQSENLVVDFTEDKTSLIKLHNEVEYHAGTWGTLHKSLREQIRYLNHTHYINEISEKENKLSCLSPISKENMSKTQEVKQWLLIHTRLMS